MQGSGPYQATALHWAGMIGARAVWLAFALLVLTTLAAFLPVPWPFALAEHGKPHLVVGGGGFTLLLLAVRKWRLGLAALACVAMNYAAMAVVPFAAASPSPGGAHEIRVVWSNAWRNTPALDRSLDYARAKDADLILIGEFPETKPLADDYAPDYPYRADTGVHPDDPYRRTRVVALSRLPIANARTVIPGDASGRPFLVFDMAAGETGGTLRVASAHVLLPMRAFAHEAQTEFIAAMAGELTAPFLVGADLNATPWSRAYRILPGKRVGDPKWRTTYFGRNKWPPSMGFMPIDHVIISDGIGVAAYEVGPDTGSSHRPLFAAIRVTE